MRQTLVSFFVLIVICCATASSPFPVPYVGVNSTPYLHGNGSISAMNEEIFYQTDNYFNFGNVRNPVKIWLNYTSTSYNYNAEVCLNSFAQELPIAGTHLSASCPAGAYATLSNNDPLGDGTSFDTHPEGSVRATSLAEVYVRPGYGHSGFVVTIPDLSQLYVDDDDDDTYDSLVEEFQFGISGTYCEDDDRFPVGSNGQCITIPYYSDLENKKTWNMVIPSLQWFYIIFDYSDNTDTNSDQVFKVNNANFTVNGTHDGVNIFLQEGYYPTENWFLNTDTVENDNDDDDAADPDLGKTVTKMVMTPSGKLFVGLFNHDNQAHNIQFSYIPETCGDFMFGKKCNHHRNTTDDPVKGILEWSASLNTSIEMGDSLSGYSTMNNGSAITLSYLPEDDDDTTFDGDYAYIKLVNLPDPYDPATNTSSASGVTDFPYFVRVTVANTDIASLTAAPSVFASWGYIPSPISSQYNMSTVGDVSHQLVLPITEENFNDAKNNPDNTWYIAVKLPVSFPIWIGTNCADCVYGTCYCNQYNCDVQNNLSYRFPSTLVDSSGSCTCDNTAYRYSYDCSAKNNGNSVAYVCIIAVGGLIILFVAIGVPVYCFISNKKKADGYEAME